mgnify:CR=1 FL=1|tara:strand:+ start:725 stop:1036 length:312 start_codon:yes stop_codon:yes gene_type:complete
MSEDLEKYYNETLKDSHEMQMGFLKRFSKVIQSNDLSRLEKNKTECEKLIQMSKENIEKEKTVKGRSNFAKFCYEISVNELEILVFMLSSIQARISDLTQKRN